MSLPIKMQPYKEFIYDFETKLVYTKKDMAEAIEKVKEEMLVNRVIRKGKDVDIAMRILSIHTTPYGLLIYVD